MLRTRLVWFGLGFASTSAAISQLIWKDLWVDRYALSSDVKQKFDSLEARVSNLESMPSSELNPSAQADHGVMNDENIAMTRDPPSMVPFLVVITKVV